MPERRATRIRPLALRARAVGAIAIAMTTLLSSTSFADDDATASAPTHDDDARAASTPRVAPNHDDGKDAAAAEDPYEGLRGFELMLRPSIGAGSSDSPVRAAPGVSSNGLALLDGAAPWSTGFVGQGSVGYRVMPNLSLGLRAGIRTASGQALSDGSQNLSRTAWDAGLYIRVYPLARAKSISRYVDPWVSTGVGYMRDTQSFERGTATSSGASVNASYSIEHHAVAVPLGIGVDFRATRFLSLGPSFEYTFANAVAGCLSVAAPGFVGSTQCNVGSALTAETYGVWSAGLDAKVTF